MSPIRSRVVFFALTGWLLTAILALGADKYKQACTNPQFPAPEKKGLEIDAKCAEEGAATAPKAETKAEEEQNTAKNNYCATDKAGTFKIADFSGLQDKVVADSNINWGREKTPTREPGPTTDRKPLRDLGEGKLVVFQGYVLKAKQEGAESVNCELGPPEDKTDTAAAKALLHEIHIVLGESKGANECTSIVAEMTPHHRPDAWNHTAVQKAATKQLPVRVTGQLFFDSAHDPCVNGKPPGGGNPLRISLWEIHPIYQFEVCPKGKCATTGWVALSDWDGK